MDTSERLNGTELKAEEQFSWAPLLWGTHLAGTQEKLLLPALSQLGSACLGLLVTGTLSASCSAPGSLHHEPENYPGLGPCDRLTWSRPLRPAPGTPGAPQQPRLVAPASPASRPEAVEGPAESLPEAHTRRRGSPDCGHGDPGPRAGAALRPARWASGLAGGRAATPLRPRAAALSALPLRPGTRICTEQASSTVCCAAPARSTHRKARPIRARARFMVRLAGR